VNSADGVSDVRPDETGRRSIASSDGVEIRFDVAGDGDPSLVFVHGWAGRRQHWDEQLERFARNHLIVRLDLAGHGQSGRDRYRWTIPSFAGDVVAAVEALDLTNVILIGHSLGGSVVVAAARLLRDRVVGVVGVDTWSALGRTRAQDDVQSSILLPDMRLDFRSGSARFVRLMCGPAAPAELVTRLTDEVAEMPPEIAIAILEGAGAEYLAALEEGLRSLDVPLSAISSEGFRPKDEVAFNSFGISNVVIPGSGHYLMLERPEEFNALLAAAIARSGE
jgi:pimeloyl-ACP methyl ester carboxylesterase